MVGSEKTRILVYFVFFLALIALAVLYRPADALSRPAQQSRPVLQNK